LTKATLVALFLFDASFFPAPKFTLFCYSGRHDKVKIGGVYITVCQDLALPNGSERSRYTGFSRAAFTAYYYNFVHRAFLS
jgi:hypothetical protein